MGTRLSGRVAQIDSYQYLDCNKIADVSCADYTVMGIDWFVPSNLRTGGTGYKIQKSTTKPSPTSVKTVRMRDEKSGRNTWFLIADNADESIITTNCNACCDTTQPLPAVTVPTPLIEQSACEVVPDAAPGPYQIFAVGTPLTAGQKYYILASKDGVVLTPASNVAGYADITAVNTFATANYSSAGTWTHDGQELALTNAAPFNGSIKIYSLTQLSANAGAPQTVTGTTVTLNGSATAGANSYSWARTGGTGDGTNVVIANPNSVSTGVSGLLVGTHIFTLTAKNQAGVASTSTVTITKS